MEDGLEGPEPPAARSRRSLRRMVLYAVVASVAAVGVVASLANYSGPNTTGATVERHEAAPRFALPNLEKGGSEVSLAALAGRPAVINFWASWCVPCRREMPAFETVYEEVGGDVAFVGVNHLDSRAIALDLVAETGITYPSGYDPQGTVAFDFGLYGMPTTVFVDADGTILEQHTGELSRDALRATIERLFGV
ncbi:MAG: TlpA family protein disulfide reductase [Acidimicrobiales bacterium]